jgi:tetratricopeptide (TPR) repeat protein
MACAALLERALDISPRRVDVYTALARTYWFAGDYDRQLYHRASDTALRALALGFESADLHFYRGYASFFAAREFSAAFDSFRRATELDPHNDRTYRYALDAAWLSGRIREAAPVLERARKYHQNSDMLDFAEVGYRIRIRDPEGALAVARAFIRRRPDQAAAHRVHGGVLAHLGRYQDSLRAYAEAIRRSPGDRLALSALSYVQAKAGDRKAARRTLAALKDAPPLLRVPGLLGLDDREALLEALAAAKAQDDHGFIYLAGDTRFDHLFADPRFAAILPRV